MNFLAFVLLIVFHPVATEVAMYYSSLHSVQYDESTITFLVILYLAALVMSFVDGVIGMLKNY